MTYLFSSTLDYGYDLPFQPPATMMSLHGWTATWRCETEKFYLLVVAFVELFYHRTEMKLECYCWRFLMNLQFYQTLK